MRSILKFIILTTITLLIPILVMTIAYKIGVSDLGLLIGQMIIILAYVLIFTYLFRYKKSYEEESLELIKDVRDIDKLKDIREKRRSFRSKAAITSQILSIKYSDDELANLKKYANKPEDIKHYFAAKIDNAKTSDREVIRENRDKYLRRVEKKIHIYPDFNQNLKEAVKWTVFFLAFAFIYNIIGNNLEDGELKAAFIIIGMIVLALIMVMAILWIVRTVVAFWQKEYFE